MERNINKYVYYFLAIMNTMLLGCETALEKPLEKDSVILLSPKDSLVTSTASQTFYWDLLDGAAEYQLQVVSPRFNAIERLIKDTVMNGTQFTIDLAKGDYEWRVRGLNYSSASMFSKINTLYIH